MILTLALLLATPDPGAEALALGRRLAETGTLAALLPAITAKETEELVAEHPDWSDADKAALRRVARAVGIDGFERLMTATGNAYASRLTIEDLRTLVAFNEGDAARRWREATPAAMLEAMAKVGELDFKADARKAFCKETGKGCPAR
jgi:hypothetical protein